MKPQQQDMEAAHESHVHVQMPNGEERNIPMKQQASQESPEAAKQTAENTPTTASSEVSDGD